MSYPQLHIDLKKLSKNTERLIDVRDIPTTKLMEMTSMVFQDVYLFNTTITENVRISRLDATDAEVADALRRAGLDQTIARLPDGAGTQVGEGGQKLSGGEGYIG